MASYRLVLENHRPVLLNHVVGRHWSKLHKAKQSEAAVYFLAAAEQGVPPAKGIRSVRFHFRGWPRGGTLPDKDAPLKVALDALVLAKLLLDDGEKGLATLSVEFSRGDWQTIIDLEDV